MAWEEYYSVLRELPEWLRKPVPFVVEALPLLTEAGVEIVLDVGCGMGRNSIYLAEKGLRVVGVDFSVSALRRLKTCVGDKGIRNLSVVRASMTDLPFARDAFHAVVSISVIHHSTSEGIERAVDEIHRVLRVEGVFVANLLSVEDHRFGQGSEIEDGTFRVLEDFGEKQWYEVHHFFSRQEVQTLLSDFGRAELQSIRSGTKEQPHSYWKVTAYK